MYRVLRKMGHDTIAMEDYVATDQRPLDKCLGDVANCDIYVGIFAWRYGYIPPNEERSITEFEFREAVSKGKPCLLFLLHEEAPWPRQLMDRDDSRIEALRAEVAENHMVSFFRSSDELATAVSVAVGQASKESEKAGGPALTELLPTSSAQSHIVDAMHRGDYTTITEAIEAAAPGDKIQVRPGLYEEGLIVDKPLEIIGQGDREEIVVRAFGKDALWFKTTMGRVSNLTLRQTGRGEEPQTGEGGEELEFYGVDIEQGRLILEGCDISGPTSACVSIRGSAEPYLRRNRIHHGKQGGVFLINNAKGTLEGNEIFSIDDVGVGILEEANPTLRQDQIHDNDVGVVVDGKAKGILEGNEIFSNSSIGVAIAEEANPTLRNNQFHDNEGGVGFIGNAKGMLEGNEIFANASADGDNWVAGVQIRDEANPTLRHNQIRNNGIGISAHQNAMGILEGNDIFSNDNFGVFIAEEANPTLRRNQIDDDVIRK